jgi:hypothetical protein
VRRVALLCPNGWDRATLARKTGPLRSRFSVIPIGDDIEHDPASFDANAFIDATVAQCRAILIDGVTSSSDYPGILVSSFVAEELGLPGPSPKAVLTSSHKYYARLAQAMAAPEAAPSFGLVDPNALNSRSLPLTFPFFIKPVKSWFSQYAQVMQSFEQLVAYVESDGLRRQLYGFTRPFNDLLRRHDGFQIDGGYLIAEQLLTGRQVTLEGYSIDGRVGLIGIVDSIMYGHTLSFRYFGYPSGFISNEIATRMFDIAGRVMGVIGFDNGLFNIEFMYDENLDTVHIIEINPRMCGQFADMMEAVTGVNSYETLLSLAVGDEPLPGVGGQYNVAASFALRSIGDAVVEAAPTDANLATLRELFPITSVQSFYKAGDLLSDRDFEFDGVSYRYAVVNIAGTSWRRLFEDQSTVVSLLGFSLRAI